jgi:hypothetical protein
MHSLSQKAARKTFDYLVFSSLFFRNHFANKNLPQSGVNSYRFENFGIVNAIDRWSGDYHLTMLHLKFFQTSRIPFLRSFANLVNG